MNDQPPSTYGAILNTLTRLLDSRDLPDPPPDDPMPLLIEWFDDARKSEHYDDFSAMTLATATRAGEPSARIVLCKAVEPNPPALVFYTNYQSRKGRELGENPRAACVFHWPHAKRQARIEGMVTRVPDAESDEYFHTRPLLSRLGARVSRQSAPLSSRSELISAVIIAARGALLPGTLTRPEHWGGYRVQVTAVELWSARQGRLHDRVRWSRLVSDGAGAWAHGWLSP